MNCEVTSDATAAAAVGMANEWRWQRRQKNAAKYERNSQSISGQSLGGDFSSLNFSFLEENKYGLGEVQKLWDLRWPFLMLFLENS